MALADMHVHSNHSDRPSDWFLQRLGASESYTDPEHILQQALSRGMDFVAVTDHNCVDGALALKAEYPDRVIVGCETTTYFPEDGCKIHLLLYGLDRAEFDRVQELRQDIYRLREYVRRQRIAHSVAHATFSVNGRLTTDHLERLLVLFDVFESVNGSRDGVHNTAWNRILASLTPGGLAESCRKHRLEPYGPTCWAKGLTGGSDDHAGLLIGRTYTVADARTPEEFVDAVRDKRTTAGGRHNDFRTLAFSVYKIAYEFSKSREVDLPETLVHQATGAIFGDGRLSLKDSLMLRQKRALTRLSGDKLAEAFLDLVDVARAERSQPVEERLELVYERISDIVDEIVRLLLDSVSEGARKGDVVEVMRNMSSSLVAAFLVAPFFSTLRVMSQGRDVIDELADRLGVRTPQRTKRVAWFTDTFDDLNGVSVTLQAIADRAQARGDTLKVVTCLADDAVDARESVMDLPCVWGLPLPYYESYTVRVPSLLRAMKMLHGFQPDEILVSTPGTLGLTGLLAARLLGIPCKGVYHTDFREQVRDIAEDESVVEIVETYVRWFYASLDHVMVPTEEYIELLAERGLPRERASVFPRGVDSEVFSPRKSGKAYLMERYGLSDGPVMLFVGRISREKGLDFLLEAYEGLLRRRPDAVLALAGDGPYRERFMEAADGLGEVHMLGRVPHEELPAVYSGADLLVFPSTTDTFGMVVLEAQACGLPCLVTDVGGPQAIVADGRTGSVLPARDADAWAGAMADLLEVRDADPERWIRMREASRRLTVDGYHWDTVIDHLLSVEGASRERIGSRSAPTVG